MIAAVMTEPTLAPLLGGTGPRAKSRTEGGVLTEPLLKGTVLPPLTAASLLHHPAHLAQLAALEPLMAAIGAPLLSAPIASTLARSGTVGRIGVPREATALMLRHKFMIGATVGADPLWPVARLWRGLQRRAGVDVDVRQCTTLIGTAADRAGHQRDVLLLSQRLVDSAPRRHRSSGGPVDAAALEWSRARDAADLAFRLAAAEHRKLLLVLPIGRGTRAQQYFTDALERQARLHRMEAPRVVKAGLLSALLSGDNGCERWLAASVIPIEELSAMAREAVGDTGPWPIISIGRDVTFIDMPATASDEPLPFLLALSTLLQRSGRGETARTLLQASLMTTMAVARMRDELGGTLTVPVEAFVQGVLANWGRVAPSVAPHDRRNASSREPLPVVAGLRLRIETTRSAAAVRDAVAAALLRTGLEVASVRNADSHVARARPTYDVRVRSRLVEPALSDSAADAMCTVLTDAMRCVSVEPWVPASAEERPRARAVG